MKPMASFRPGETALFVEDGTMLSRRFQHHAAGAISRAQIDREAEVAGGIRARTNSATVSPHSR